MGKREKTAAASGAASPGLTSIVIGGREYPCRVTMGALVRFKRATGHDVSRLDTGDMEEMMTFLWCCVASACAADGVEMDLSMEGMADRIEPADLNGFYGSMAAPGSVEGAEKKAMPPLT